MSRARVGGRRGCMGRRGGRKEGGGEDVAASGQVEGRAWWLETMKR